METTKNLINRHMDQLCHVIGPRPTGSQANGAAVHYAATTFRELGCGVTLQEFPCMDWKNNGATLTMGGTAVEVVAAEYSLPCNVCGELVCVSNIEELKETAFQGKICVMYGELCKEPLMPKNFTFWNPEEHREIIRELERKQPLAILTVSPFPDTPIAIIQDGDFGVPCGAVKGDLLNTLLCHRGKAKLRLMAERRPSTAANVIATFGTGEKKVSFSAHIDTKPNTPGALDNASGVATLLALAAKVTKGHSPYQIEFTLFNGEDYYSTPGENAFMQSHLQQAEHYVCAFNVDGVGLSDSPTSYSFYECPKGLMGRIEGVAGSFCEIENIDPWPMGDHMLFAMSGVPAVAMTASHIFALLDTVVHTPKDNLSLLDSDKLAQVVDFLFACI